jgi:hypothetical protein
MKKSTLLFLSLVLAAVALMSCASTDWGVARLPDARTLFITTAKEQSFVAKKDLIIPYQPVGFLGIKTAKFQPCGGNLTGMYTSLERAMAQELIDKAKNELSGDAIIDMQWWVSSSYKDYLAAYAQMGSQVGIFYLVGLPAAYVFNFNVVDIRGTVVKKK